MFKEGDFIKILMEKYSGVAKQNVREDFLKFCEFLKGKDKDFVRKCFEHLLDNNIKVLKGTLHYLVNFV